MLLSLDASPTRGSMPSPSVLKLWEQRSDSWMYGARLNRSGPVVERSTGLMTDFPTMSPVCLHHSCFGENIIKGLETFIFSSPHPPPRRWEADPGWVASLGSYMPRGQNSFPEVMDVSGLVSSCYLSTYRPGCFHNDADLWLNVSQSSEGFIPIENCPLFILNLITGCFLPGSAGWIIIYVHCE